MPGSWSTWDYNAYLVRKGFSHVEPGGPAITAFYKSLHSGKWPKFPSLFPWVSDIRVLACEKDLLVQIENAGNLIGQWLYSTFVPQPSEVARKFLTGKTKKGYFGLPLEFAPLDIIWTSGDATKILATITSPLATGLYYLWLMQTSISALQTAQMVGLLLSACPDNADETLLADGLAFSFIGTGDGSLPLWQTIQDPHHRYNSPGSNCTAKGVWINASMHGYVHSASEDIASLDISLTRQGQPFQTVSLGAMHPGTIRGFSISGSTATQPGDIISSNFHKVVNSSGASGAEYVGIRWTMNSNQFNPNPGSLTAPGGPCNARFPDAPRLLMPVAGVS